MIKYIYIIFSILLLSSCSIDKRVAHDLNNKYFTISNNKKGRYVKRKSKELLEIYLKNENNYKNSEIYIMEEYYTMFSPYSAFAAIANGKNIKYYRTEKNSGHFKEFDEKNYYYILTPYNEIYELAKKKQFEKLTTLHEKREFTEKNDIRLTIIKFKKNKFEIIKTMKFEKFAPILPKVDIESEIIE